MNYDTCHTKHLYAGVATGPLGAIVATPHNLYKSGKKLWSSLRNRTKFKSNAGMRSKIEKIMKEKGAMKAL
jgi:hypothetical protein